MKQDQLSIRLTRKILMDYFEFSSKENLLDISEALSYLNNEGYNPLFMPELVIARIEANISSRLWNTPYLTPSARFVGNSRQGNPVVVYTHVHNYLSDHKNIRALINDKKITNNGAAIIPYNEFYNILDLEGNGRVFVLDYNKLLKTYNWTHSQHKYSPKSLLSKKPNLILPFLGINEQEANLYIDKYIKIYPIYENSISLNDRFFTNKDIIGDEPLGRLLYLGETSITPVILFNYVIGCLGVTGFPHSDILAKFLGTNENESSILKKLMI